MISQADPRGSTWRRWDPHIHTPGTLLNDGFGEGAWEEYLTRIEQASPQIEALGITDYYSIDQYETVLQFQRAGRLPDVGVIFPNIEMRLPTATRDNTAVNMHLLISPLDPDHIAETRRFLRSLTFETGGESYSCHHEDLVRLGRRHHDHDVAETVALRAGANLFKVSIEVLKAALAKSVWAQHNIIVGIAVGQGDGTSGVRDRDESLLGVRQEIERIARVVFSGSPRQRDFWTGQGPDSPEVLLARYDGMKTCLHGSDAHSLHAVGMPDQRRYTWIKGDATFETLKQACLEPRERVIVASRPPDGALDYRVIDSIALHDTDWVRTPHVPLAPGLVAIIGARGSGKTALADLIAAGAGASSGHLGDQTFLQRAHDLLGPARVDLTWADGSRTEAALATANTTGLTPRVQYLSQQFVERLCSSEGITDELLAEIERVMFEAHLYEQRLGASSFRELLDLRAGHSRDLRRFAAQEVQDLTAQIEDQRTALDGRDDVSKEHDRLGKLLEEDKRARSGLIVGGGEQRAARLGAVNTVIAQRQGVVDAFLRRKKTLEDLVKAVEDLTTRRLPAIQQGLRRDYTAAGLTEEEWQSFTPEFRIDPVVAVRRHLSEVAQAVELQMGPSISQPALPARNLPAYLAEDADLDAAPLNILRMEAWRLGEIIGLDDSRQRQLRALNDKIAKTEGALASALRQLEESAQSSAKIRTLTLKRSQAYASIFDGYLAEQNELETMYTPLREVLGAEAGTLGRLTFSVKRTVNAHAWAEQGERLLDLRTGVFRGRGELLRQVHEQLVPAWERGDSAQVSAAMAAFREKHQQNLASQALVDRGDRAAFRRWALSVSAWLNSTDHVTITYGVEYDGVAIEQLSPGTRGIVLLLLYLAVDQSDDRPLIIDQPEENLDPRSIFQELVGRFVSSRSRRQIIIVTHNANLVVNTDVDQVIIASAGEHRAGRLPEMTYTSGGLENPAIRREVCEILEGGQHAFEERARRLRIALGS